MRNILIDSVHKMCEECKGGNHVQKYLDEINYENVFQIPVNHDCSKCKENLEELDNFIEHPPYKYGNRITLVIHQDFLGFQQWHIESVKFDNYEEENLRAEYEKAKLKGAFYDIQGLLDNLEWNQY